MVVFSFFYDHWMLSYSTKRLSGAVPNVIKCRFDDISPINSASSGRRGMNLPPFDSSRRAGSNGGIPIRLRPLDAEIFDETSNGAVPKVIKTPI